MPREANAVDFWRGFALVSIFVNHVPGIYYERFTHRNLSFSDSAELFVFLAGWSLGLLVYGNGMRKSGPAPLTFRLGGRSLQIYTAHIVISGLALALLAGAAYLTDTPPILEWHNAAAFFQDPARTQLGIALLTHQLGYFDILPLYVVLMLIAPAFVIIDRFAPALLLPLSLSLYFTALIVPFTAPTWPVEGQWFFNPFTWQAIFILGLVLSRDQGLGHFVRRNIRPNKADRVACGGSRRDRGLVRAVPRSHQAPRAQDAVSPRQELPYAGAAPAVPGAGGSLLGGLSRDCPLSSLAH